MLVLCNARQVDASGVRNAPLFVADERIACEASSSAWELDLRDHLILPGLINAHDHLPFNCFPALASSLASAAPQPPNSGGREPLPNPPLRKGRENMRAPGSPTLGGEGMRPPNPPILGGEGIYFSNSYAWIEAFQAHMDDPAIVAARTIPSMVRHWHGALKNLLCGVTTVQHHDPWHSVFDAPGFPVRVVRDFGWSHSLGLGLPDESRSPLRYGPEVQASFAETSPDQPWIIHLAEGTDAIAAAELDALAAMGCLSSRTVLVHGVGLREQDIQDVIAAGASVVWCPGSNLMMLGQTLEPHALLQAGKLMLGSDSRISGSADLLADLRLAAELAEATPKQVFALVTEAGSRLLHLPEVGGLAPTQRADLLILPDNGGDPYASLLTLARAEIRAVVRDGKPVLADPDFAEWFVACGVETTPIRLDGRPKLCATSALGPDGATQLEPGLEIGL